MVTLEEIIRTYGDGLARTAAAYEADRSLQQDLLQDTLLAIHRALPGLRDQASLTAFVFRIAHNRGVTHALRERNARRFPDLGELEERETGPESKILGRERIVRLHQAVRRLPLPYRQVVALLLEDLTYGEIAQALGLSLSNVGVRVSRAKAMLKEILDER